MCSNATRPRSGGRLPAVLRRLLLLVEHLEHPLGRGDAGLQQVGHRGELGQRLGEHPGVLDEGLHVAEAHRPAGDPQPTDDGDRHVVQVPDEEHRRHDQPGDELGAEAALNRLEFLLGERRLDLPLPAEHLDQGLAGERLLDVAVQLPGGLPLRHEHLLGTLADHRRHDDTAVDRRDDGDRQAVTEALHRAVEVHGRAEWAHRRGLHGTVTGEGVRPAARGRCRVRGAEQHAVQGELRRPIHLRFDHANDVLHREPELRGDRCCRRSTGSQWHHEPRRRAGVHPVHPDVHPAADAARLDGEPAAVRGCLGRAGLRGA